LLSSNSDAFLSLYILSIVSPLVDLMNLMHTVSSLFWAVLKLSCLFRASSVAGEVVVQPRIIGGSPAPVGRYPYYAFIQARRVVGNQEGTIFCGATLIAPDVLMVSVPAWRECGMCFAGEP
jgi:hypothetical protein